MRVILNMYFNATSHLNGGRAFQVRETKFNSLSASEPVDQILGLPVHWADIAIF